MGAGGNILPLPNNSIEKQKADLQKELEDLTNKLEEQGGMASAQVLYVLVIQ